jgi:chromosomal replication initiator protein
LPSDRELARTWQGVLGRLQHELKRTNFQAWLDGTRPIRFTGDTLLVRTPHPLMVDWVNQQFATCARRALTLELGRDVDIRFVANDSGSGHAPTAGTTSPCLPPGLNTQYTFASYLPVSANQLALAACKALLDDEMTPPPGTVLIWGAPGSGKSHLLHATAACAALRGRDVVVLSGEDFTDQYQQAIRDSAVGPFQARLRAARILVIDDLQVLAGREGTLKQLVATSDAVLNRGGQVLMASEVHPSALALPARLASRLYGGLVVEIEPISTLERRAFVEHLARVARVSLPAWCVDRIAALGCGSARLLRGGVTGAAHLDRCGVLDEASLDKALAGLVIAEAAAQSIDPAAIIERIAAHYAVTPSEVRGRSRKPPVRDARAAASAALAVRGKSLAQIAALFDGRDPSTISDLVERGKQLLKAKPDLQWALAS